MLWLLLLWRARLVLALPQKALRLEETKVTSCAGWLLR